MEKHGLPALYQAYRCYPPQLKFYPLLHRISSVLAFVTLSSLCWRSSHYLRKQKSVLAFVTLLRTLSCFIGIMHHSAIMWYYAPPHNFLVPYTSISQLVLQCWRLSHFSSLHCILSVSVCYTCSPFPRSESTSAAWSLQLPDVTAAETSLQSLLIFWAPSPWSW